MFVETTGILGIFWIQRIPKILKISIGIIVMIWIFWIPRIQQIQSNFVWIFWIFGIIEIFRIPLILRISYILFGIIIIFLIPWCSRLPLRIFRIFVILGIRGTFGIQYIQTTYIFRLEFIESLDFFEFKGFHKCNLFSFWYLESLEF